MINNRRAMITNVPYQLIDSPDEIVTLSRHNSEAGWSVITEGEETLVPGYGSLMRCQRNGKRTTAKEDSSPEESVRFDLEENEKDLEIGDCDEGTSSEGNGILYFSGGDGDIDRAYSVNPVDLSKLDRKLPKMSKRNSGKANNYTSNEKKEMMLKLRKYEQESMITKRYSSTMEVIVSKIFPAGFFWQLAATLSGFSDDTLQFTICAGIGEAIGVLLGHTLYQTLKSSKDSDRINLSEIIQTGLFLATGTLCSATSWQPIVNTLQGMGLPFLGVLVGTWIMATYAFNFGLRLARNIYSEKMKYVECPTWENSRIDMLLSISVGGASALFVGTDIDYRPEENFLKHLFGIHDEYSSLYGAFIAGCSTSIGFGVIQFATNLIFPAGKCWID